MAEFTLFIVDDEPLIVEGLLRVVSTFTLPLSISGFAYSGEEALELIKELKPDIILSDIRMNNLDGLELCRQVKALLPLSKTIILSGYNDFALARTALQQKVFDYLLKPIDRDILLSCLQKAVDEIVQQRKSKTDATLLKKYLEHSRPYIRDLLFNYLQSTGGTRDEQLSLVEIFEIPTNVAFYVNMHISFSTPCSLFSGECYEEASTLFSLIDYLLADYGIHHISFFDSDGFGFVLAFPCGTPLTMGVSAWDSAVESIRNMLEFNSSMKFSIGLSNPVESLHEIPREYNLAKIAGGYRFFMGDNKIISYRDLTELSSVQRENSCEQAKKDLLTSIMVSDKEQALCDLGRFFLGICYGEKSISSVKQNSTELFLAILNTVYLPEIGDGYPEEKTVETISFFWQCRSVDDIKDRLWLFILLTIENLQRNRSDKTTRFVARIKQIIEKNYREVSLSSICEEIQLSPSYTSNLFSSMEKTTIKDYIIAMRVQKAKELLQNPSCKIYDVSDMVGYNDPKYFSQVFKKHTGLTPEQFRNCRT